MLIISSNMATQRWYYIKTSFLYSQKVTASLVSRVELSYATKSKRFPKNMENIFFITAAQPNLCTHTHAHTNYITPHLHFCIKPFQTTFTRLAVWNIYKKYSPTYFSRIPFYITQRKKTLCDMRHTILDTVYLHTLYSFFYKKKEKSLPATFRQTRTICHTGEESWLKRVFWWRRLRQSRRTEDEKIKGRSGNRLQKHHQHLFVRTQDGFQCEGGCNSLIFSLFEKHLGKVWIWQRFRLSSCAGCCWVLCRCRPVLHFARGLTLSMQRTRE